MRRSLAPYNYNFKRRGGESIEIYRDLLTTNKMAWNSGGSYEFGANGLRCYSDGAYSQLYTPLSESIDNNFSMTFGFSCAGQGSGNEQHMYYFGNYGAPYSYYLVMYVRQYSAADTWMAWKIAQNGHTVKADASHFYVCEKYNWYNTAGTWYRIRVEITNKVWIKIKVWPWAWDEPGTWDYNGLIYLGNVCGFERFYYGLYTPATSGNGAYLYDMRVDKLIV